MSDTPRADALCAKRKISGNRVLDDFTKADALKLSRDLERWIKQLLKERERMLKVIQLTYLKHHCGKDVIGWDALSEKLGNVLCDTMSDDGYVKWLAENAEDVEEV